MRVRAWREDAAKETGGEGKSRMMATDPSAPTAGVEGVQQVDVKREVVEHGVAQSPTAPVHADMPPSSHGGAMSMPGASVQAAVINNTAITTAIQVRTVLVVSAHIRVYSPLQSIVLTHAQCRTRAWPVIF